MNRRRITNHVSLLHHQRTQGREPEFPGTPAKTHGYGQNGVSFECVRECVYGYAEYAEELDAQTVKAHRLIAGPIPVYYPINEDMARREKE